MIFGADLIGIVIIFIIRYENKNDRISSKIK